MVVVVMSFVVTESWARRNNQVPREQGMAANFFRPKGVHDEPTMTRHTRRSIAATAKQ
jgi:hypothetical protein